MISAADLLQGWGFSDKPTKVTQTKDVAYLYMIRVVIEILTSPSASIERAVEEDGQPMVRHV